MSYSDYQLERDMDRYSIHRSQTENGMTTFESSDSTQGKIFWLPAKEDLPDRAVRRAHGKGAVEEGIFNHPVVVISHPSEASHTVHFHLITSLQGKSLDQLYAKMNEFHASRRSWYLPVAPTPDHPDALSKKTKKRFPTLELANGVMLRWNSYVNIRHVYKIDIELLERYTNPDFSDSEVYRFKQESLIRMLAKGKTLTMYEPGPQFVESDSSLSMIPSLNRTQSAPTYQAGNTDRVAGWDERGGGPSTSYDRPPFSVAPSITYSAQWDFHIAKTDGARRTGSIPKVPPDGRKGFTIVSMMQDIVVQPTEQLLGGIKSVAIVRNQKVVAQCLDHIAVRQPLERFWRDLKGVTAVVIAST